MADEVEQLRRENQGLKSQLADVTAKLKHVESEIEPLKHKLQVTEQALLFNSNLVLKYMESNPLVSEFQEKLKHAEEKAKAAVEAELTPLKQKLRVAEQALLFNSLKQMETSLANPAKELQEKEEEIKELRRKLGSAEQKAKAIVDTEIRPLQHKLQVAEQALLFNADMYHNLMESSTAGREQEVDDLKEKLRLAEEHVKQLTNEEVEPLTRKLRVAEQALMYNTYFSPQAVVDQQVSELKQKLEEAENKALQTMEATIQPLRNKLTVAEQALLLNANLYFRHLEEQIRTSDREVQELRNKVKLAEEKRNVEEKNEAHEDEIQRLKLELEEKEKQHQTLRTSSGKFNFNAPMTPFSTSSTSTPTPSE